jgi:hypothetical protein
MAENRKAGIYASVKSRISSAAEKRRPLRIWHCLSEVSLPNSGQRYRTAEQRFSDELFSFWFFFILAGQKRKRTMHNASLFIQSFLVH